MIRNIITFNPISPAVIRMEGVTGACPEVAIPAGDPGPLPSAHSGQVRETGESPKLRSNSFPHCGQRSMGIKNNNSF
jgi:hypothetical protein